MLALRSALAVIAAAIAIAIGVSACRRTAPALEDGGSEAGTAAATRSESASSEVDSSFTSAAAALEPSTRDGGTLRPRSEPPAAGTRSDIPAGSFPSGSTPGDEGRDPTTEPALVDVSLAAFAMDALAYPNDPALPAKLGLSIEEARRLCRDRGARLCSELEWERACKGPENEAFATGTRWDPACEEDARRCASGFGPRGLGALPELTDSRFASAEGSDGASVLRGGSGASPSRRCAARTRGGGAGVEVGFRCCTGPSNEAKMPAVEQHQGFKKAALEPAQLAAIFAPIPELARLGRDIRLFTEGDVRAIIARTGAAHDGITFMTTPILWSPESGAELLVAAGRGKTMSFVVALWTVPGDRYRFASAFLMLNDLSPVALAFESPRRKELRWTSCWGCPGEQGTVSYRPDDHRVVIVQQ